MKEKDQKTKKIYRKSVEEDIIIFLIFLLSPLSVKKRK